eukprot:Partr_v1_DN27383_c0_g1_i3_m46351 putative leucine rich repeat containing 45
METFKENYLNSCHANNVEPLQHLLDKISFKDQAPNLNAQELHKANSNGNSKGVKFASPHYQRELDISNQTLTLKMAKALADAIHNDSLFIKISLADCLLGDDGCIAVCNALKENSTLEILDLRGNNIRADGCLAIAQLIKINSTIRSLSLEWNCVGIWDNGIKALGDALNLNQHLENLDLRNNKIGPSGGAVIAAGLKSNTVLKSLDLRWNNLGLVGGRCLLDMLKWNQTLLHLELQGNELPDDLARAIEMALERNRKGHSAHLEASTRAHYLSNTLQQMSVEHEETIQSLRERISHYESQTQSLGGKLNLASDEIENTHLSYKVIEKRIQEEREKSEHLEMKYLDLEATLVRERQDFAEKCQALMNDLIREREQTRKFDENYRLRLNSEAEGRLSAESKLKDIDVRMDRLQRENDSIKRDNAQLVETSSAIESRLRSEQSKYQEKLKETESINSLRVQSLEKQMHDLEIQLQTAVANARLADSQTIQDLTSRLQTTSQQRDAYQMTSQQSKSQIQALESRIELMNTQLLQMASERTTREAEMSRLSQRQSESQGAMSKLQAENQRLREDLGKTKAELDRQREDEINRAKGLEKAIMSYVQTVERSLT